MKSFALTLLVLGVAGHLFGQTAASPALSATPGKKAAKKEKSSRNKTPVPSKTPAPNKTPAPGATESNGPTTTEIYADEAFFDSSKNIGIFTGNVKVTDPRFNLQSDKLTVYVSKGENQGLEKAIAEGNVALVRDRPEPAGSPPTRSVGRAEMATYVAATGDVELKGDPRVQEGMNTHVAASTDTVMVITHDGHLSTHGPSRTEIRQQPGGSPSPTPAKGEKTGSPSPKEQKGEKKPEASTSPKP